MGKVVTGALIAAVGVAALLVGARALAGVVVVVAALALVDASLLLGRAGARPVLLAALLPGLVLPVVAAMDPAEGWARAPVTFAGALVLGFALLIVFGRRRGAVAGLGATMAVSLLVGLGAASLVLLRALPDGFRWVVALAVLVLAADGAGPLLALTRRGSAGVGAGEDPAEQDLAVPLDAVLPGLLAVVVLGGLVLYVLAPPLTWMVVALLGAVALIAALGGDYLQRALTLEAGVRVGTGSVRLGRGGIFALVDAILIAAPAAYVVARSAVL